MLSKERKIQIKAKEMGFDLVGFAPATPNPKWEENLKEYIANESYGDMEYLAREPEKRANPEKLWDKVKTIIVFGINFYQPIDGYNLDEPSKAYFSGYARGSDYHDYIKKKLKKFGKWMEQEFNCEYRNYCDTAPVMEKPLAERAALGWQGKHSIVISRELGTNFFLSEIYTDLELETNPLPHPNHCGKCMKCATACPTNAVNGDYKIIAKKCISYLTIEHKGSIPVELREKMGNRVYGCDDCLVACPWNKYAKPSTDERFALRDEFKNLSLSELSKLTDETFRALFTKSAIRRTGRDRFVRNVAIAMGNSKDKSLIKDCKRLLDDDSELVREHALWALEKLERV